MAALLCPLLASFLSPPLVISKIDKVIENSGFWVFCVFTLGIHIAPVILYLTISDTALSAYTNEFITLTESEGAVATCLRGKWSERGFH